MFCQQNRRFKTPMLRLGLCDYSDAYINVKGRKTIESRDINHRANKKLTFKNISPFTSCMSKINHRFIENAENLDIFMPMYNLL